MGTTKRLTLEKPSFDELLPTKEVRRAFDDKTASFEAGRLVRNLRKSANLTQAQLAARLGVTQARVSTIEAGEGSEGPTFGVLKRIVLACGFRWDPHFGVGEGTDLAQDAGSEFQVVAASTLLEEPKAARARRSTKSVTPSKELAAVIGSEPMPRTVVVNKVWNYIKKHKLQNAPNKKEVIADAKLKAVFGKDRVTPGDIQNVLRTESE